jgi:uncharacterized repeat protein (TIGR03803 family)
LKTTRNIHSISAFIPMLFIGLSLMPGAYAQTITQLFAFPCSGGSVQSCPDGARPFALIQASDGNLYGAATVTQVGGSTPQGGTVFKLTSSGQFTRLFAFSPGASKNYPQGDFPVSLVEGTDGFLYGVAGGGGAHRHGSVFKISKTGTGFHILHSFCALANCADGASGGKLVLGRDGNFYGASAFGGSTRCTNGCGTIYGITPTGQFTTIHMFNGTDGNMPSGLTLASDGNFYGWANLLQFRITPAGQFTSFSSLVFANPRTVIQSDFVQGADGKFYGVACHYELHQHVLFEVGLDGSNLQTFSSFEPCQLGFRATLLSASDGNLWEGTLNNSSSSVGSMTALSPQNGLIVRSFSFDGANGSQSYGPMIQGKDGTLYGTTYGGGTVSTGMPDGVVFSLSAGLPPLP